MKLLMSAQLNGSEHRKTSLCTGAFGFSTCIESFGHKNRGKAPKHSSSLREDDSAKFFCQGSLVDPLVHATPRHGSAKFWAVGSHDQQNKETMTRVNITDWISVHFPTIFEVNSDPPRQMSKLL